MSNNIRVKGYDDISFWQEDGIGLIVLRSSNEGFITHNTINELISAIGTASIDDDVKSIAITGHNNQFSRGLFLEEKSLSEISSVLESTSTLISMVYSLEKPVFSVLSGDAIDLGYELALMTDAVLSGEEVKVGFNPGYRFMLGGSMTSSRFRSFTISEAKSGSNVDRVFQKDSLLENAKEFIKENEGFSYHLLRKRTMSDLRTAILEEREYATRSLM